MSAKLKGKKRAVRRNELQETAAQVQVPEKVELCVVGGGAAGLVASIVAAEQGAQVVVLERELECGRTILATGNGRCNFTNAQLNPALYNDPSFVAQVCGSHWLDNILDFFSVSGLAWATEAEGRMYPLSRQAASVRNVLLARAQRAGVLLAPLREVVGAQQLGERIQLNYREAFGTQCSRTLSAARVILSTGGGASSVSESLGITWLPTKAVLCPLACQGPALTKLDGRRAQALLALTREGQETAHEEGEVLFRSYGLSGIAIFNLSRSAQPGDEIVLDLLPQLSLDVATHAARHTLDGLLDPVIAEALAKECKRGRVKSRTDTLRLAKHLRYQVLGTADESRAQVTRGGLATTEFDPHDLSCKAIPGLFACGEALDIDGPCGGFNLAWAWKSGMVAGMACAKKEHGND